MKQDYYDILQIKQSATQTEVKAAYRKMALQFHPDRNPDHDAEERFKQASEAYEVLGDPQRRALYDQFGHAGLERQGFHGFEDVGDIFSHFSDIFDDFFGMGSRTQRGRSNSRHGRDLRYDLPISFMESYRGCEKAIELNRPEVCDNCEGKGYPKGHEPIVCSYCGGKGQLLHSQGFFTISTSCGACHGHGRVVKEHCPECRGRGLLSKLKKLSVKIPAGVDNGTQLCLRGEGEAGQGGGQRGDLYVVLEVEEHSLFKRHGDDLLLEKPISMVEAALGEEIIVDTPDAKEKLKVPRGAQTGHVLKLKGKGMPHLRGKNYGDLLVQLFVETPRDLSPEQEKLLRTFTAGGKKGVADVSSESSFTKKPKSSKKSKKSRWF